MTGLFTAGGAAGAGAGIPAWQAASAEGPAARTAVPTGPGAYAVPVTFRTEPSTKIVALTIDDGPTPEWTPQVLAILRRHRAKATFFRVGERAQASPELVVQTAREGHEQGNHTWAHDDLTHHGETFDLASLKRTHEILAKLTGQPPTLCRPPWGRIDSVGLAACASIHYRVTLWSHRVAETGPPLGSGLPSPGSIVLFHDGGSSANASLMNQLDRLVASLTDAGYRFVTVSELLAASA